MLFPLSSEILLVFFSPPLTDRPVQHFILENRTGDTVSM